MKPTETVELIVGVNRKGTFPAGMGLNVGDKLLFRMISDTEFNVKVTKAGSEYQPQPPRKMRLYGLILGHRKSDDKWLGLYLDQNGARCAMQVSSSLNYLKGDLSRVGPKAIEKLNKRFNGLWDFPEVIEANSASTFFAPLKIAIETAIDEFNHGYFDIDIDDLY